MKKTSIGILSSILILVNVGCTKSSTGSNQYEDNLTISENQLNKIESKIYNQNINLGDKVYDIYNVFTETEFSQRKVIKESNLSIGYRNISEYNKKILRDINLTINKKYKKLLAENLYKIGDSKTFYIDPNGNFMKTGILVSQTEYIPTKYGNKRVSIWVSQESLAGNTCGKEHCIDSYKTDILANKFLSYGDMNDIYDYSVEILGEHWSDQGYQELITNSSDINIFIHDIDDDNSFNGGTLGYFYAKDIFTKNTVSGSNEMNLFYIDSQMLGNDNDFWDKKIESTLIHEFQHMISFYQRNIVGNTETSTFVAELMSLGMEDLLAYSLELDGLRGVEYPNGASTFGILNSEYLAYLYNPNIKMNEWSGTMLDYSKASLFSGYLLRNTDSKEFYRNLMDSRYTDYRMISDAYNKTNETNYTFSEIVHNFGVALMMSDLENLDKPYRLNFGDWDYSQEFPLGSINRFDYPVKINSTEDLFENVNSYKEYKNVSGSFSIPANSGTYIFKEK